MGEIAFNSPIRSRHSVMTDEAPHITAAALGRPGQPVHALAPIDRPFCALRAFHADATPPGAPRVLIVAPFSGPPPAIFLELIRALLAEHMVHLTDWRDPAEVPLAAGRFGLEEMIGEVMELARLLGPRAHLLGISQSGPVVLAAAALMAADADPARPASITLLGGLLDTRLNPTPMNRMAQALFGDRWLSRRAERTLIRRVAAGRPGAGRLVYPAAVQHAGLLVYLLRRISPEAPTVGASFAQALLGHAADRSDRRLLKAFLATMDVPAELYLDTMRALFGDHLLATGRLTWRGRKVEPAAIRDIALLTVEAGRDDISGRGQTHVAHALCPHLPEALRSRCDVPGAGHLGMIHGPLFRRVVLPRLREHIARAERARAAL
jgi:poly(3-hydroxybutyrate) depolymerase